MGLDGEEIADYQARYDSAGTHQTIARRHFRRMPTTRLIWVDWIIWAVLAVIIGMAVFTVSQF